MDYTTVEDLPPARAGKVDWEGVVAFARQHPGEWVEVPLPLSQGVPYQIKRGSYPAIPMDEFEVTSRKSEPTPQGARRCIVYLRKKT